jgi:hypothetical protein
MFICIYKFTSIGIQKSTQALGSDKNPIISRTKQGETIIIYILTSHINRYTDMFSKYVIYI